MVVNDVVINRIVLQQFILLREDHTEESVNRLLKPHDAQDVPRAIELLQTVHLLKDIPTSSFHPGQLSIHSAICLLGDLLNSLTQPFVNRTLSLSQQIEHLSHYAHLAFALYRRHTTSFASNQFYGDSQAMVKNALFVVAKHQIMSPTKPLYLTQLGDDRLESLFGRVRMIGGHNPNCDFKTLTERLAAALGITDIFLRHPSWDVGSRRLSMKRAQHLDHLKPSLWTGDVISGHVRLQSVWNGGREKAVASLHKNGAQLDFLGLFALETIDLMRPFSGEDYPGVASGQDRSSPPAVVPGASVLSSPSNLPSTTMTTDEDDEVATLDSNSPSSSGRPSQIGGCHEDVSDANDDSDSDSEDQEPEDLPLIDLADLLEDTESEPSGLLPSSTGSGTTATHNADWLQYEGKWYHKASLVRCMFDFGARKSFERVDRVKSILGVRTYSSGMRRLDPNSDNITGVATFSVGDLFASLIKSGKTTALGVFQCTSIDQSSARVHRVSEAELSLPLSNIKLSGQLLDMYSTSITLTGNSTPQDLYPQTEDAWVWTGDYVQLVTGKPTKASQPSHPTVQTQKISKKSLLITFPSFLTSPVTSVMHSTDILLTEHSFRKKGITSTWVIGHEHIEALSSNLWESARSKQWLSKIPVCGLSVGRKFPYLNQGVYSIDICADL